MLTQKKLSFMQGKVLSPAIPTDDILEVVVIIQFPFT